MEDNSKKTRYIIGILIGIIFVLLSLGLIIALLIYNMSINQVTRAMNNTFSGYRDNNSLLKAIDVSDIMEGNDYTAHIDVDTEISRIGDVTFTNDIFVDKDMFQVEGSVDFKYIPPIEYICRFDDEKITGYLPIIPENQYAYYYHYENDGFLLRGIDDGTVNLAVDQMYKMVVDTDSYGRIFNDIKKVFEKEIRKSGFSKTEDTECTINGEQVKCKGYSISFDAESLNDIADGLSGVAREYYKEFLENIGIDPRAVLDNMNDKNVDHVDLNVYIYKNDLAKVEIKTGEDTYELNFYGGDYRAQNFEILINNTSYLNVEGSLEDGIEECGISKGIWNVYYSYVVDSGVLDLVIARGRKEYDVDLKINRVDDSLMVDIDYLDLGDTYIGGTLSIEKGAEPKAYEANIVDIGKADEEKIQNIKEDIYEMMMEQLGY